MAEIAFNEKVAERFKGTAEGQGGIVEFLGFEITDAGLKHIRELTDLTSLSINQASFLYAKERSLIQNCS